MWSESILCVDLTYVNMYTHKKIYFLLLLGTVFYKMLNGSDFIIAGKSCPIFLLIFFSLCSLLYFKDLFCIVLIPSSVSCLPCHPYISPFCLFVFLLEKSAILFFEFQWFFSCYIQSVIISLIVIIDNILFFDIMFLFLGSICSFF